MKVSCYKRRTATIREDEQLQKKVNNHKRRRVIMREGVQL